jgi:hypothetical protein
MLFACTARTDTASRMLAEPPCRTATRGTGPRAPSLNRSTAARSPTGERARRRGVQRQRRPLTSAIVSLDLTRRGVREEREGQKKMNRKEGRLSRLFAERHSSRRQRAAGHGLHHPAAAGVLQEKRGGEMKGLGFKGSPAEQAIYSSKKNGRPSDRRSAATDG